MSEPLPRRPVPPGATGLRRVTDPRFRGGVFRGASFPLRSLAVLVAVVVPLGAGTATARVLPGPEAGAGSPAVAFEVAAPVAPGSRTGPRRPWPAPARRPADATGVWPLRPEPEVVVDFAPPPVAWAAGHRGVDLLGRPGEQVRAARAGTVAFAGRIAGRGVVVLSHGDTRTTYEPVAASVSRGQRVRQGAVIGELELLGSHCLPRACLHWGLVRDETYLDPLTLVGQGPVRLVPWSGLPASPWP